MIHILGHLIGLIGMGCVVYSFHAIENKIWNNDSMNYYVTNLVGAILLIISLVINFNLGSFVIEIFWIWIALKGIKRLKNE